MSTPRHAPISSHLLAIALIGFTLWSPLSTLASESVSPETNHRSQSPSRAFVFISNSIPEAQLLTLAKDATALRLPLVLRGLPGASLQDTLEKMRPIAQIASIEVDPLLYEAYGVEAVPAVVLTCGDRGDGPFAILYGVGPSAALPRLRKQLSCE